MSCKLEPLETNSSAPEESGLGPANDGAGAVCSIPNLWHRDFNATRGRHRQRWRPGWDRFARCPVDPKDDSRPGREPWREHGFVGGTQWRKAHDERRQVVRTLRAAGYQVRKRWERHLAGEKLRGRDPRTGEPYRIPDYRYSQGPVRGLPAIDPWDIANNLSSCGSGWEVTLRVNQNGPLVLPLPRLCGRVHVCPICAGQRSQKLARALRDVIQSEGHTERCVFVTLTQRASRSENLDDAQARLRDALRRMWSKRPAKRWKQHFRARFYGIEVTRGAGADRFNAGEHWHVHAHLILRLADDVSLAQAQQYLLEEWQRASKAAAVARELPEHGWDPVTGLQQNAESYSEAARRLTQGELDGPWWRPFAKGDDQLSAVYQACKYPSPVSKLAPGQLAEFLAVAYGRRWHDGGGDWRGIISKAKELAEQSEVDESRIDIGINISARSPGDCPQLIEIDPLLGLKATERVPTRVPGALSPFQAKQQNPLITDAYLQQQRALAETHGNRTHRRRETRRPPVLKTGPRTSVRSASASEDSGALS